MIAGREKESRAVPLPEDQLPEVQRLALTGYDYDHASHLVLMVKDAVKAREFLAELLQHEVLTFSDRGRDARPAVNFGFTYRGLEALGLSDRYLKELQDKAPAFRQGALVRAARRLGDTGPSAAERWEPIFGSDSAHMLVSIHGADRGKVDAFARELASVAGARQAFECVDSDALRPSHLTNDSRNREVHFGYRDNITRPVIAGALSKDGKPLHGAGELLLGYPNDEKFNRWSDAATPEAVARFFGNGSFAVLRKIEQHEERFNDFLKKRAVQLDVSVDYLKARLCGRWPKGARVMPGEESPPKDPTWKELEEGNDFDFEDDRKGFGCPFGAHIRRTNPRGDPVLPLRRRPLFRRGMPYGPKYGAGTENDERGLIGLFFCASIEDQFEHVMSEWVEKKPMGPPNRGNAKDPLIGHHDEADSMYQIPRLKGGDIELRGFEPFVTTRGTLYAFYPSRHAMHEIAGIEPKSSQAAKPAAAKPQATAYARPSYNDERDNAAEAIAPDNVPKDRFCDVVMEGGVTSGIIYASAVAELSKHYRFRSIGGSSIGAFAAALTAAAEYSRRYSSGRAAFDALAELPGRLAEEDSEGKTLLQGMFRPQKGTRRLFEIFLAALGHKYKAASFLCALTQALRQYRLRVLIAAVVTGALALGPFVLIWLGWSSPSVPGLNMQTVGVGSWTLALLIALAFAVVLALLLGIASDFRRGLVPNGFGLCRGWSDGESDDPPDLAGFLHESIQKSVGRDPSEDPPLTFKDLWDAPGGAMNVLGYEGDEDARRSINLEIYATNLAHGRPYRFPLQAADDMGRLFFRIEQMADYFPKRILKHLLEHARPYRPLSRSDPDATLESEDYLELPREHLPIAVAARLALSFPLLISAVPLWAIDYEPRNKDQRGLAECWLSDGGLCSNFPIHLFDSFLPKWPTFGISLQTRGRYWDGKAVWLPDQHYQGGGDTWNRFADAKGPLRRMIGFLLSLWMATWRWNDMTMMRMPGVRDRVVRVLLKENEGGVNIKMTGDEITGLAKTYGKPAAEEFVKKFAAPDSFGWNEHRWVRFNRLLISLREQIDCFTVAADLKRYTLPIAEQIDVSRHAAPLRGHPTTKEPAAPSEKPLGEEQVRELRELLSALRKLESMSLQAGSFKPYIAVPRPSMRIRHPT